MTAIECQQRYYQRHREALLKKNHNWAQKNPDIVRERSRRHYHKNIEKERSRVRIYSRVHQKERTDYGRERRHCAKKFCPQVKLTALIRITCLVCGKDFGILNNMYNSSLRRLGHPPFYCSKVCQYIGMSKRWQQKHSPYAKKIKELQRVHG